MIHAVELTPTDPLRRDITYVFVMDTPGGVERFLCVDGDTQGWFTWQEIHPGRSELASFIEPDAETAHTVYTIRLNPEMLHALTEVLIVRATNTPMAAIAGIRKDLEHERSRRDLLEDTVIRIAEKRA
jgi:hypothetical protein